MESEKVKEIRIALCKKSVLCYRANGQLKVVTSEDILTLINELESENERLVDQRNKTYNIWVKDTEKLKDRIAELEKENKDYYDRLNNLQTYIDNHEEIWKGNTNNALKQFAEMLKDKLKENVNGENVDSYVQCVRFIREILDEFMEGANVQP